MGSRGVGSGTRFLTVAMVLLIVGAVTVALGFFVLAAVDPVGAVLFFLPWVRHR